MSDPTLEDLIARGTCPECGTFGGIWHKLGCSQDIRTPRDISHLYPNHPSGQDQTGKEGTEIPSGSEDTTDKEQSE